MRWNHAPLPRSTSNISIIMIHDPLVQHTVDVQNTAPVKLGSFPTIYMVKFHWIQIDTVSHQNVLVTTASTQMIQTMAKRNNFPDLLFFEHGFPHILPLHALFLRKGLFFLPSSKKSPAVFWKTPRHRNTKSLGTKRHFQKVSEPRETTGSERSASSLPPSRNASASARRCAPCRKTTRLMGFVAFLHGWISCGRHDSLDVALLGFNFLHHNIHNYFIYYENVQPLSVPNSNMRTRFFQIYLQSLFHKSRVNM